MNKESYFFPIWMLRNFSGGRLVSPARIFSTVLPRNGEDGRLRLVPRPGRAGSAAPAGMMSAVGFL